MAVAFLQLGNVYSFLIDYLASLLHRLSLEVHYDLRKKAWNPPPLSQVSAVNSSLWNWETLSAPRPLATFIQVLPAVYPRTESKHTLPPDSELLMRRGCKGGQGGTDPSISVSFQYIWSSSWGSSSAYYSWVCPLERWLYPTSEEQSWNTSF